jgi:Holliday junction resolvase RusA-like endonuclease
MKIKIPIHPLSVNKAWQGRKFKSKDYKKYEEEMLYFIKGKKTKGFVEVKYDFYIKYFSTSDVGNFEKPLSDIIVKAGLIEDDKYIKKITMEKFKSDEEFININIKKWK